MIKKISTTPNLSETSLIHNTALELVDGHFKSWQHNVLDHFKGMSVEDIKSNLADTASPFAVCMENWIGDFNFGTLVRNANAFNAKEVFYIGDKKWDRRSSVGVYNYTDVNWLSTIEDFIKLKEKYTIIGIDNIPGKSIPISTYNYPLPCLLVFGSEGTGLTETMQSLCKDILHIDMIGSVRSLNCGTASGIAMYDLIGKL